jgi:hypothetical protein
MRHFLVLVAATFLCGAAMQAQPSLSLPDRAVPAAIVADSASVDSLPRIATHRLLPENMSLMERGMWGEHGILRGVGIASPLTPEVRKGELGLRRTMLSMHQIGGFVTLGFMFGAVYAGQRVIDGNRNFRQVHQTFVTGTILSYGTTAMLAILSPPPTIRRDEVSTTTIHKTLAWIHFAGMILTPILGASIHRNSPVKAERFHQISAYATTAAFTASMIIVTF